MALNPHEWCLAYPTAALPNDAWKYFSQPESFDVRETIACVEVLYRDEVCQKLQAALP